MPPVSVIVICRDRVPHVSRCIASLLAQEGVSLDSDYEIIVVEQGNGNRKILADLPVRHIVLPYGRTTSMAWLRNVGTRRARFDWLYHMDCDMSMSNRTVSKPPNPVGAVAPAGCCRGGGAARTGGPPSPLISAPSPTAWPSG